jgi:hypothetical protein
MKYLKGSWLVALWCCISFNVTEIFVADALILTAPIVCEAPEMLCLAMPTLGTISLIGK